MFDIGWSELLLIGVVALIAIGPKELPGVLRSAGQWIGKIRSMASEFQSQFQEAMREAEMADLKKEVDTLSSDLNAPFDPAKYVDTSWSDSSSSTSPAAPTGTETAAADTPAAPVEVPTVAAEASVTAEPPAPSDAPAPTDTASGDGSRPA